MAFRCFLILFLGIIMGALAGCAGMGGPTYDPPDVPEYSAARQLYIAKCSRCHRLYDPTPYPEAEWRMWLTKMSKKAKLSPAQEQELTLYIENVIRKPQNTR